MEAPSYPLVVDGTVYVTAGDSGGSYGTTLYALDQATGAVIWQHGLGGTYYWSGLAYDAGRVFAVNYDGLLSAFDAVTGDVDWSYQLPGQYAFSSPPTAVDGIVYDGGAGFGGTLYANRESSGAQVWTNEVATGDNSSPAVDGSDVFVTYPDNYYAFDRTTGASTGSTPSAGMAEGGRTPVVADGHVFVRDGAASARIVSEADGAPQGPLASTTAPAVANGTVYQLNGATLQAVPEDGLGSTRWSFAGDDGLDTAPLVTGSTIWGRVKLRGALRRRRHDGRGAVEHQPRQPHFGA